MIDSRRPFGRHGPTDDPFSGHSISEHGDQGRADAADYGGSKNFQLEADAAAGIFCST